MRTANPELVVSHHRTVENVPASPSYRHEITRAKNQDGKIENTISACCKIWLLTESASKLPQQVWITS
jgi:hypothetical protein